MSVFTSDFSGPIHGVSSYPDYLDLRRVDARWGADLLAAFRLAGLLPARRAAAVDPIVALRFE